MNFFGCARTRAYRACNCTAVPKLSAMLARTVRCCSCTRVRPITARRRLLLLLHTGISAWREGRRNDPSSSRDDAAYWMWPGQFWDMDATSISRDCNIPSCDLAGNSGEAPYDPIYIGEIAAIANTLHDYKQ
eukprot:6188818-Pleurochrysis_carterae.AAC.3